MNRIKRSIYLLAAVVLAASCTYEDVQRPETTDDGLTQVTFAVQSPSFADPGTRVLPDAAFENGIDNLAVIILQKQGGDVEFYLDSVIILSPVDYSILSEGKAVFTLALPPSTTPKKFLITTNYTWHTYYGEDGAGNVDGLMFLSKVAETSESIYTESAVVDMLSFDMDEVSADNPNIGDIVYMPMTGQTVLETIEFGENRHITVPVIRSVARADIQVNLIGESDPFEITEVWAYRMNTYGMTFPLATSYAADGIHVVSPTIYTSGTTVAPYAVTTADPDTFTGGLFASTYLTEAATTTDPVQIQDGVSCLVVGGRYNGSDVTTYYRLDFNSGIAGHPFGQILRNYRYTFNIVSVKEEGWATAALAATNKSTAMVYQLDQWQDDVRDIYFGQNPDDYFKILDRDNVLQDDNTLSFNYHSGNNSLFYINTTRMVNVNLPNSGLPAGMDLPVDNGSVEFGNDYFDIYIQVMGPDMPEAPLLGVGYLIIVTTKQENLTGEARRQALTFRVGGGDVRITLSQEPAKTLVVYSYGTGQGTLGNMLGNGGTAPELRAMLESTEFLSRFPSVNGVEFWDRSTKEIMIESDQPLSAELMKDVDIIVVPHNEALSDYQAWELVIWQMTNGKVLFYGEDKIDGIANDASFSAYYYPNLDYTFNTFHWLGFDGLIEDTTDALSALDIVGLGDVINSLLNDLQDVQCIIPAGTPAGPILDGEFGTVASTPFDNTDNEMGYVATDTDPLPSQITPLIYTYRRDGWTIPVLLPVLNAPARTGELIVGVDLNYGVVYMGESDLMTDPLANESLAGTTDPHTKLMANLWAWAFHRVVGE